MRTTRWARVIVASAVVMAIVAAGPAAQASYPGGNGDIAYVASVDVFAILRLRAIAPNGSGDHPLWMRDRNQGDAEYAPDGTFVIIAVWGRNHRIINQDLVTSERSVVLARDDVPGGGVLSLGISPDGSQIVFCALLDAGQRLFTVGVDGSNLTKISRGTDDCHADWGISDRIAATQELPSGMSRVFTMLPDGSDRQELVSLETVYYFVVPNWAPDASRVIFGAMVGDSGQSDLWTVNEDGTGFARLFKTKRFNEYGPLWAPDGSGIVYSRIRSNHSFCCADLWLSDTDGKGRSQLTDTPNRDEYTRSWQALSP